MKRVFRIYPGYVMAFLISVYLVGAIGADNTYHYWSEISPGVVLRQLALLQPPSTPATFTLSHYPIVNGALWTINYEFACYLLILGLGASGFLARRRLTMLLWMVALAGFAIFRISHWSDPRTGAIDGGHIVTMVRFLPMFLAGAFAYRSGLYKYSPPAWLIVAAAVTLVIGLSQKITAEIAVASVGAYLLIWFGHLRLNLDAIRRMPDVSYGVYLYGWPIQKLVIASGLVHRPAVVFVLSLGLSLLAGFGSWHLVEKRALQISSLLRQRARAAINATR